jgi:hypothetical protein
MLVLGERVRAILMHELGVVPFIGPARPPDMSIVVDDDKTQYYSIMFDLATDTSKTEQFCLHIKTVGLTSSDSTTRFVALRPAAGGSSGAAVQEVALTTLSQLGIPVANCLVGATDGCAAMIGVHSGALTRISSHLEGLMIMMNCQNHRLALGCAGASESVDYVCKTFKNTLSSLFVHIAYSPKRIASLSNVQKEFGKAAKLVQNGDTRWLSINATIISIRESLIALIVSLTVEQYDSGLGAATAGGLVAIMGSEKFLRMLLFWSDLMPVVNDFSLLLQTQNLDFEACDIGLKTALSGIAAIRANPGLLFVPLLFMLFTDKLFDLPVHVHIRAA